jgi:hypothetical protein
MARWHNGTLMTLIRQINARWHNGTLMTLIRLINADFIKFICENLLNQRHQRAIIYGRVISVPSSTDASSACHHLRTRHQRAIIYGRVISVPSSTDALSAIQPRSFTVFLLL